MFISLIRCANFTETRCSPALCTTSAVDRASAIWHLLYRYVSRRINFASYRQLHPRVFTIRYVSGVKATSKAASGSLARRSNIDPRPLLYATMYSYMSGKASQHPRPPTRVVSTWHLSSRLTRLTPIAYHKSQGRQGDLRIFIFTTYPPPLRAAFPPNLVFCLCHDTATVRWGYIVDRGSSDDKVDSLLSPWIETFFLWHPFTETKTVKSHKQFYRRSGELQESVYDE